jgi:hypothetical protein
MGFACKIKIQNLQNCRFIRRFEHSGETKFLVIPAPKFPWEESRFHLRGLGGRIASLSHSNCRGDRVDGVQAHPERVAGKQFNCFCSGKVTSHLDSWSACRIRARKRRDEPLKSDRFASACRICKGILPHHAAQDHPAMTCFTGR